MAGKRQLTGPAQRIGTAQAAVAMYIRRPLAPANAGLVLIIDGGIALHIVGRTLLGVVTHLDSRLWHGPVAALVIAGITPGLLMGPPLVAAIATTFVGSCLVASIYWKTPIARRQMPG
ncbi:hypothetical protein JNW88_30040 [Micromonospora sp. ATA32]|nr:hypothetical protein [Micromonospora sp. ATA32]